mgnify:CR=1 FL=1
MCTATTDLAPSTQPALAPFVAGATYVLAPWRAQWLNDKLVAISNKALKRGIAVMPALLATSEPYSIWHRAKGWDGDTQLCAFADVCKGGECPRHWDEEIVQDWMATGEMPVLKGGWHLVAAIDRARLAPDQPVSTIVREAPGRTCPAEFRGEHAANRCDHCKVQRARSVVYVLADAAGSHIQVGSSCVAEFIRDANVEAAIDAILAAQAAWAGVPTEDEDGNPLVSAARRAGPQPLHTFLSMVGAYTRDNHNVYVTRSAAGSDGFGRGKTATADAATSALEARTAKEREAWPDLRKPCDALLATAAIEWAKALPADGSTFEQNMRTFAHAGFYTRKHAGTAGYIVPAYQKATQQAGSYPARLAPAGRLQADVGTKATREVEIIKVIPYESQWSGFITVMRVVSGPDAGATVKWMSSNTPMVWSKHTAAQIQRGMDELAGLRPAHLHQTPEQTQAWIDSELASPHRVGAQPGDRVTIEFKVKAHSEYKGALETIASHVKCVCQGWGYACEADTDEARIRDAQIAAGNNAPIGKTKPARKPRAKKVQPLAVDATQTA